MSCYDPAGSQCSGKAQPGSIVLAEAIDGRYAHAIVNEGAYGIYACRDVSGGSNRSVHGDGRAVDVGFPMPAPHPEATALTQWLIKHQQGLGIQFLVYNHQKWNCEYQEWRAYDLTPHEDHVHVEQRWEKALNPDAVRSYLALVAAQEEQEKEEGMALPVMVPILWLPKYDVIVDGKVVGKRIPSIEAKVSTDGKTRLVGRGVRIDGATWSGNKQVRVVGTLAAPICELAVDKATSRVVGVAGDGGTFEYSISPL